MFGGVKGEFGAAGGCICRPRGIFKEPPVIGFGVKGDTVSSAGFPVDFVPEGKSSKSVLPGVPVYFYAFFFCQADVIPGFLMHSRKQRIFIWFQIQHHSIRRLNPVGSWTQGAVQGLWVYSRLGAAHPAPSATGEIEADNKAAFGELRPQRPGY